VLVPRAHAEQRERLVVDGRERRTREQFHGRYGCEEETDGWMGGWMDDWWMGVTNSDVWMVDCSRNARMDGCLVSVRKRTRVDVECQVTVVMRLYTELDGRGNLSELCILCFESHPDKRINRSTFDV
jgi:hypothetical protein